MWRLQVSMEDVWLIRNIRCYAYLLTFTKVKVLFHVTRLSSLHVVPHQECRYEDSPLFFRGPATRRTVQGMKSDNQRFLAAEGDITKAKEFNNCILEPLFDIPLSVLAH